KQRSESTGAVIRIETPDDISGSMSLPEGSRDQLSGVKPSHNDAQAAGTVGTIRSDVLTDATEDIPHSNAGIKKNFRKPSGLSQEGARELEIQSGLDDARNNHRTSLTNQPVTQCSKIRVAEPTFRSKRMPMHHSDNQHPTFSTSNRLMHPCKPYPELEP